MIQNPYISLIWDMDGVLVDSAGYHLQSWREILKSRLNREISVAEFRDTFGMRNPDMLRIVLGMDLPLDQMNQLADAKEARYRELLAHSGISLLPGVAEWLDYADTHGWRQAVASSAPRLNVEAVVDAVQIRSYFTALIAAEDVQQGKPSPEVYLTAARLMGMPASQCIVIEDAPAGIEGARQAGMACIGLLTTHSKLDADIVVPSLSDLAPSRAIQLLHALTE